MAAAGEAPGSLQAERDAPVGGQAVLEGVMMRGISTWAVAVRTPTDDQIRPEGLGPEEVPLGEIAVESFPLTSVLKKHRVPVEGSIVGEVQIPPPTCPSPTNFTSLSSAPVWASKAQSLPWTNGWSQKDAMPV